MTALNHSNWSTKLAQAGLMALLLVAPPVCALAPRALALFLPLAAALCLPLFLLAQPQWRQCLTRNFWLSLAGLGAFAAIGTLGAPNFAVTIETFPAFLLNLVSLCVLLVAAPLAATQRQLLRWAAAGLALTLLLVFVEYAFGMPVNGWVAGLRGVMVKPLYMLDRTVVLCTLLIWPVLAYGTQTGWNKLALYGAMAAAALAVFQTSSQASSLGFSLGALLYFATLAQPRLTLQVLRLAVPALLLLAPLATTTLEQAVAHDPNFWPAANTAERLKIWTDTTSEIARAPWLGQGFDATRRSTLSVPVQQHPHNGMLQIWLETGLAGAVLAALALSALLRRIAHSPLPQRAWQAAAFGTWLVIFCVGYNIWQTWWQATALLVLFLFMQLHPYRLNSGRATPNR